MKPVTGNFTGYRLTGNRLTTLCQRHTGDIPATEGNKPRYWSMMPVTICFVIPLIEMDTELEAIVNQVIKFKISTTQ